MTDILLMLDELEELVREEVSLDRAPAKDTLLITGELKKVVRDNVVGRAGIGAVSIGAVAAMIA